MLLFSDDVTLTVNLTMDPNKTFAPGSDGVHVAIVTDVVSTTECKEGQAACQKETSRTGFSALEITMVTPGNGTAHIYTYTPIIQLNTYKHVYIVILLLEPHREQ